jgi:hypothetical protein
MLWENCLSLAFFPSKVRVPLTDALIIRYSYLFLPGARLSRESLQRGASAPLASNMLIGDHVVLGTR